MNKKTIMLFLALMILAVSVTAYGTKYIETYGLRVIDNAMFDQNSEVRIDGNIHIGEYSQVEVYDTSGNPQQAWSGTCDGNNLQVLNGLVIGCGYE